MFVCACTIVTLIRFLCHLDVFFGIQVDMVVVVGGTSGETEKADCRRMGWKLGCFQRGFFFFFSPHVSCSPHHFRRVSVCNVHCTTFGSCPFTLYFPLVRPRTVTSRRRGLCERFLTFKGKQSEAGKHFSFAGIFSTRSSLQRLELM